MKTPTQLWEACSQWLASGTPESFANIVGEAFETLGAYQRDLADDFEVAESTVSRWARGIARPHPLIQRQIVQWICRRAKKQMAVKSGSSGTYSVLAPVYAKGQG